jgi:hypothetical protein
LTCQAAQVAVLSSCGEPTEEFAFPTTDPSPHMTASIDLEVVLSGELTLELDESPVTE